MYSHHQHTHHQYHRQLDPPPPPCCRCCLAGTAASSAPSSAPDELLQAIAAHLLQSSPTYPQAPQPPPVPTADSTILRSLHRRIAALESYVYLYPPDPTPRRHPWPSGGLRWDADLGDLDRPKHRRGSDRHEDPRAAAARDSAARTIQLAFRRFLVQRSQMLGQLRKLALIRSQVAALRASVAQGRRLLSDPKQVSRRAVELLHRLECIQECDPMVREGKRATHRELSRVLNFVDHVLVKEQEKAFAEMEIVDGRTGGPSPRRKKVSFAGEGSHRATVEELEDGLDGDDDEMEGLDGPVETEKRPVRGHRVVYRKPGPSTPLPENEEFQDSMGHK